MKNITTTLIAIIAFATANAQMITRSSISCMSHRGVEESVMISHSIGKASLVNIAEAEETATEVAEVTETPSVEVGTLSAYPNPAVGNLHFSFELAQAGTVTVSLYNGMGQKVSEVLNTNYDGGKNTQQIDLTSYSAGVYFLSLNVTSTDGSTHTITKQVQIMN